MKKISVLSFAALTVLALSQQRASAWCQWKFGIGLNLDYKGGGNNFLWGAYKSQQPPAPGVPGYPGAVPAPAPGPYGPTISPYGPPFGGGFEGGYGAYGAMGYNNDQSNSPAPATAQTNTQPNNKVQPVGYQVSGYSPYGYSPAAANSPATKTNYAQPPSYWYGK
jgi:hypothetical protein